MQSSATTRSRRTGLWVLVLTLTMGVVSPAVPARADYAPAEVDDVAAPLGTSPNVETIHWLDLSADADGGVAADTAVNQAGSTWTVDAGDGLVLTATIDAVGGDTNLVTHYAEASAAVFRDAYGHSATDPQDGAANTGLGLLSDGATTHAQRTLTVTAAQEGVPVDLDVVYTDTGANGIAGEQSTVTVVDGGPWRPVELLDTPTLYLDDSDPTLWTVARMDSAHATVLATRMGEGGAPPGSATVELDMYSPGNAGSVHMLGVILPRDHGAAPASYGDAAHRLPHTIAGAIGTTPSGAEHRYVIDAGDLPRIETDTLLHLGTEPPSADFTAGRESSATEAAAAQLVAGPSLPVLRSGADYVLEVQHDNSTGVDAYLAGWIDLDADGTFDPAERTDALVAPGAASTTLTWTTPADVTADEVWLRLRLGSDLTSVESPTGPSPDGEVEDHLVPVSPAIDCLPAAYLIQGTTAALRSVDLVTGESETLQDPTHSGAINAIGFNPLDGYLYGYTVAGTEGIVRIDANHDVELLGTPTGWTLAAGAFPVGEVTPDGELWLARGAGAGQQEWARVDLDPTSATYMTMLATGTVATPSTQSFADWAFNVDDGNLYTLTGSPRRLWRFNLDDQTMDEVADLGTFAGSETLGAMYADADGFLYGSANTSGQIHRVRMTAPHTREFFVTGPASGSNDGARCVLAPTLVDFGDAPDSYGTTLDTGARHGLPTYDAATSTSDLMIGTQVGPEPDGQPAVLADADTFDDGLSGPISSTTGAGTTIAVEVTNDTAEEATLAGWIDLDGDGSFESPAERATTTVPAASGLTTQALSFPAATTTDHSHARFRIFPGVVADPSATGPAAAGEVEDHRALAALVEVTKTADPESGEPTTPGQPVTYTLTVRNISGVPQDDVTITDDLSAVLDDATLSAGPTVTPPSVGTAEVVGDLLTFTGDLGPVGVAEITYTVTVNAIGDLGDGIVSNAVGGADSTCDVVPDDPTCRTEHVVTAPPLLACTPEQVRASQRYWFLGDGVGLDFGPDGDAPTQLPHTGVNDPEGTTVVTDTTGRLQFWTDAGNVYDRDGNVMPNGAGLMGNPSAVQTVASFPAIGREGVYFVVTTDANHTNGQLRWSEVDMSLNGGLGDVTANKNLALGSPGTAFEALAAIPNADGTGFWVLTTTAGTTDVLAYAFDGDGPVTGTAVNTTLSAANGGLNGFATLNVSPDLSQVVLLSSASNTVGAATRVTLLDVNAITGRLTEVAAWQAPTGPGTGATGYAADFSPSGDHVYVSKLRQHTSGGGQLFRYDVATSADPADIAASMMALGTTGTIGGQVRRGPDGRMYVANGDTASLGVVHAPDDPVAPVLDPDAVLLADGAVSRYGLPQTATGCALPTHDVTVSKAATPPSGVVAAGQDVTYAIQVTNVSGGPLVGVTVTDDLSGVLDDATLTGGPTVTGPGSASIAGGVLTWTGDLPDAATATVTYTVTVGGADELGDGVMGNVATAPDSTCEAPATDPACGTTHDIAALQVAKSAAVTDDVDADGQADPGDELTYTITVTNTGTVTVAGITVDDPLPGLSALVCDTDELAPTEVATCTATYVVTDDDLAAGSVTNAATAGGTPTGGAPLTSTPGTTTTTVPSPPPPGGGGGGGIPVPPASTPELTVTTTITTPGPVEVGDPVDYEVTITNTGDVPIADVDVPDGLVCQPQPPATLEPGEAITCTGTTIVTEEDAGDGSVTVEVTASGTDPDGGTVSDSGSSSIPVGSDPDPDPDPVEDPDVERISGATRIETAIAASLSDYGDGEADVVILARDDVFADALSGTPMAIAENGPILLTRTDLLLPEVVEEIRRVLGAQGKVYLLGGTVALTEEVEADAAALGYPVERLHGPTRVETSIAISRHLGDPGMMIIAGGEQFADALTAAAAAGAHGGAVLLTSPEQPHPSVDRYLAELDPQLWAVGGPAARAYPDLTPVTGSSRDATAVAVAETFYDGPATVGFARLDAFPDALTGGAHIARKPGPLLLTQPTFVPDVVRDYVCGQDTLSQAYVYGGTAAVSNAAFNEVVAMIDGGC